MIQGEFSVGFLNIQVGEVNFLGIFSSLSFRFYSQWVWFVFCQGISIFGVGMLDFRFQEVDLLTHNDQLQSTNLLSLQDLQKLTQEILLQTSMHPNLYKKALTLTTVPFNLLKPTFNQELPHNKRPLTQLKFLKFSNISLLSRKIKTQAQQEMNL